MPSFFAAFAASIFFFPAGVKAFPVREPPAPFAVFPAKAEGALAAEPDWVSCPLLADGSGFTADVSEASSGERGAAWMQLLPAWADGGATRDRSVTASKRQAVLKRPR
ncbi:hypothetical protein BON30_36635 [Cystobacter ferrugineus]|uniref:Uncharacterized protein n=1 Tax=Cystobacter ferrugineus TaxID=83449 RepID=A0A1L9B027_9BACT|nr:hypothetical protein BON30_36635 [Cystobacter ferrugineus]